MEMFKTPEIAAEITLQPVNAFAIDAAIIFADILLPLEGMGISISILSREKDLLSIILSAVRPMFNRLKIADPEGDLGFVLKSLQLVRSELNGKVPLIGFAGAPFTLASYAIEGAASSNYLVTKEFMYRDRGVWDLLMGRFCDTIIAY